MKFERRPSNCRTRSARTISERGCSARSVSRRRSYRERRFRKRRDFRRCPLSHRQRLQRATPLQRRRRRPLGKLSTREASHESIIKGRLLKHQHRRSRSCRGRSWSSSYTWTSGVSMLTGTATCQSSTSSRLSRPLWRRATTCRLTRSHGRRTTSKQTADSRWTHSTRYPASPNHPHLPSRPLTPTVRGKGDGGSCDRAGGNTIGGKATDKAASEPETSPRWRG